MFVVLNKYTLITKGKFIIQNLFYLFLKITEFICKQTLLKLFQ